MKAVLIGIGILIAISATSLYFRYTNTVTDRIVMKNSFQYKEGMEQRAAILEASLVELEVLLQSNPANRQDLVNQKTILKAQLRAITINE